MLGPVDYVVLGFQGNRFDGSIMRELTKAVDDGIIRVIDLLFIVKDAEGNVEEGEFRDQSDDLKQAAGKLGFERTMPLIADNDVEKIGSQMENDTAAGVLIIEHLWAKGLKKALSDAGGFLIDDGRIHPEVIEMAMQDLETASTE